MSDARAGTQGDAATAGFWRQVFLLGLEVDPRRIGGSVLPLAVGLALGGSAAVLYLLGDSWSRLSFIELFAILIGGGIGFIAVFDTLTRRPALLAAPTAHVVVAALATVLLGRLAGAPSAGGILAWSLGLHGAAMALLSRLWVTFLWQRTLGGEAHRRAELLEASRSPGSEHLLVRVTEVAGGACVLEELEGQKRSQLRAAASLITPRPRAGLIYLLPHALVISRRLPRDDQAISWEPHLVRADRSLLLGTEPEVAPPEVSSRLARQAALALAAISLAIAAVSVVLGSI